VSDATLPPLLLLIGILAIPGAALLGLALVRLLSPWSQIVEAHGVVLPPPRSAHRVSGQTIRVGPRYSVYALGRVVVSRDTLWLGFSAPGSWFFREVMVPLDDVSLHTPEDWLASGARVELLGVPGVSVTLRGDGAQLVIARLG
jgi:hypothetical protein